MTIGLSGAGPFPLGVQPVYFVPATPAVRYVVSGITKNSSGAVLASCVVTLFESGKDEKLQTTTSDGLGQYIFNVTETVGRTFYVVAYKAGSPDVAGTTVNTLVAL